MPKTTTILFDCDNTLVKSEEIAFAACARLSNEILEKAGRPERYTGPRLQADFVGQNFRGMLTGLAARHDLELDSVQLDDYVDRELAEVIKGIRETPVVRCDGVEDALKSVNNDRYLLSVVSSSALSRVVASLEVTGLDGYFGDRVYSAASSLPTPTSKPDPAIYLHACAELDRQPEECVAIEDSRSGATAAVRAGIPLIGYVGVYEDPEERADAVKMLEEVGAIAIMNHWDELSDSLAKVEAAPVPKI